MKFVVANSTSNKVIEVGAAAFSGDFTIYTTGVTYLTGRLTLLDFASKTFDYDPSHFTVVGFTLNVDGVTWTKVAGLLLLGLLRDEWSAHLGYHYNALRGLGAEQRFNSRQRRPGRRS